MDVPPPAEPRDTDTGEPGAGLVQATPSGAGAVGLSFRFKLALTMLALVLAVSAATLLLVERRVRALYQEALESRFEKALELVEAKATLRTELTRRAIAAVTRNIRLTAALEVGDTEQLYSDLEFELVSKFAGGTGELEPGRLFFRFINDAGRAVAPPISSEAGGVPGYSEAALQLLLGRLATPPEAEPEDKVGYRFLAPAGSGGEEAGAGALYEVLVTPIFNLQSGLFLGDLVYAERVGSVNEITAARASGFRAGLLLGGRLHSDSIPASASADVLGAISGPGSAGGGGRKRLVVDGGEHLIFVRPFVRAEGFPEADFVALFPLAELDQLLSQVRATVLLVGLLALAAALGLSLLAALGLARPVRALAAATGEVQRGNLRVRVPVRSEDELGRLAAAFNAMAADLELKEKYRSVLDKVSDRSVTEALLGGKLELGGEEREVTVLFCDIRGFTSLTEGMPPREVIQMLNEHMTALARVVERHRGVVDKYVGDEIMVLFGAPKSYGEDALDAARCALGMLEERERLNREAEAAGGGGGAIQIGVGLASGEVLAGCMGSAEHLSYTVLGEQVNLAARLCGAAPPGSVLIDANTRERLGTRARTEPASDLLLKGFASARTAFKLTGVEGE